MSISVVIGEKLHIVLDNKEPGKQRFMVSQVLEKSHGGTLVIAMPILQGRLVPIRVNKIINIVFYRPNGVYEFKAQVAGRSKGKVPSIQIQALSPIKKTQRRNYFRLNTILPVQVSINCVPGEECAVFNCLTLDISAGGMRLASNKDIDEGCTIGCDLVLAGKPLSVKAKVVRRSAVYNKEYAFEIGVQFIRLEEKVRCGIIAFIFEEQKKLKKKGLI